MRYADDILILCRSQAGAKNARVQATMILDNLLKLKMNEEKTHLTNSRGVSSS